MKIKDPKAMYESPVLPWPPAPAPPRRDKVAFRDRIRSRQELMRYGKKRKTKKGQDQKTGETKTV